LETLPRVFCLHVPKSRINENGGNLQDGGRLCSKAVMLYDYQALLPELKAELHQMTAIFEILYT